MAWQVKLLHPPLSVTRLKLKKHKALSEFQYLTQINFGNTKRKHNSWNESMKCSIKVEVLEETSSFLLFMELYLNRSSFNYSMSSVKLHWNSSWFLVTPAHWIGISEGDTKHFLTIHVTAHDWLKLSLIGIEQKLTINNLICRYHTFEIAGYIGCINIHVFYCLVFFR